jgi:hypothetical protein
MRCSSVGSTPADALSEFRISDSSVTRKTRSAVKTCGQRQIQSTVHPNGRFGTRDIHCDILLMLRRVTLGVVVVALLLATMVLAFSAKSDYCLPWQERVGHGDGPLEPGQDFTACR